MWRPKQRPALLRLAELILTGMAWTIIMKRPPVVVGAYSRHTDADSIPDYLDIDSDDDGILDNVEAQTTADFEDRCGNRY